MKKKEFCLSDKESVYSLYKREDVKEFIRLLKEELLEKALLTSHIDYVINKLVGDKLIGGRHE